jgi:hypothetical protein
MRIDFMNSPRKMNLIESKNYHFCPQRENIYKSKWSKWPKSSKKAKKKPLYRKEAYGNS